MMASCYEPSFEGTTTFDAGIELVRTSHRPATQTSERHLGASSAVGHALRPFSCGAVGNNGETFEFFDDSAEPALDAPADPICGEYRPVRAVSVSKHESAGCTREGTVALINRMARPADHPTQQSPGRFGFRQPNETKCSSVSSVSPLHWYDTSDPSLPAL